MQKRKRNRSSETVELQPEQEVLSTQKQLKEAMRMDTMALEQLTYVVETTAPGSAIATGIRELRGEIVTLPEYNGRGNGDDGTLSRSQLREAVSLGLIDRRELRRQQKQRHQQRRAQRRAELLAQQAQQAQRQRQQQQRQMDELDQQLGELQLDQLGEKEEEEEGEPMEM
ncbi:hypothetical protein V8C40DRAFT_286791 [Trichoderma camerunense]